MEAGHRCAIHTCRHPDVDIHHIVPWEQCRKHEYENLIALCPNCHRRADAGEIDRVSLRVYKARVVAAFGITDAGTSDSQRGGGAAASPAEKSWRTEAIREKHLEFPVYEVALDFPQFASASQDVPDLNVMLRSDALEWLLDMRGSRLDARPATTLLRNEMSSQIASSYEVSCLTDELVSVRFSVFHYGAGAAHPNHWTRVKNVQLNPLTRLGFESLFAPGTPFLRAVSQSCIARLTTEKDLPQPSDWILRGAGEDIKNFSKFNIVRDGLLITFDEYQIDCYAVGGSQVVVEPALIRDFLNPRCAAFAYWSA